MPFQTRQKLWLTPPICLSPPRTKQEPPPTLPPRRANDLACVPNKKIPIWCHQSRVIVGSLEICGVEKPHRSVVALKGCNRKKPATKHKPQNNVATPVVLSKILFIFSPEMSLLCRVWECLRTYMSRIGRTHIGVTVWKSYNKKGCHEEAWCHCHCEQQQTLHTRCMTTNAKSFAARGGMACSVGHLLGGWLWSSLGGGWLGEGGIWPKFVLRLKQKAITKKLNQRVLLSFSFAFQNAKRILHLKTSFDTLKWPLKNKCKT